MKTKNMDKENEQTKIVNHNENCNVFTGPVYGASFPLPGSQVTINQYYDRKINKEEKKEGNIETAEEREKRKKIVMKAITAKFNFKDEQLAYDKNHKKITNDRLANLFRKCFGISYTTPSQQNQLLQEQLWVLLIDDRNQCFKTEGEMFFRQTVLNIIGYFANRGIIMGTPQDLAKAIFKDADSNLAKNIKRNITSNVFPKGLADMLDYYINNLLNENI